MYGVVFSVLLYCIIDLNLASVASDRSNTMEDELESRAKGETKSERMTVPDSAVRTFPAMFLSNWIDGVVQWASARNNPNDAPTRPRGVTGFRQAGAWGSNAIGAISYGLSFGSGPRYDNPKLWEGPAYVTHHGQFTTEVTSYGNATASGSGDEQQPQALLPFSLSVSYFYPPGEAFFLESFAISHAQSTPQAVQLFHFVQSDPAPSKQQQEGSVACSHNGQFKDGVMAIDETACNQGFYCAAAYPPSIATPGDKSESSSGSEDQMQRKVRKNRGESSRALPAVTSFSVGSSSGKDSPLSQWVQSGALNNQSAFQGQSLSIGTVTSLGMLKPNETATIVFVHVLRSSESDARNALARALQSEPSHWIKRTREAYEAWLAKGQQPSGLSKEALQLYRNSLVLMKNSQNPGLGTFVASFHPAYGYKVWARDAIFNAMAMDVAGYYDEADLHWKWIVNADLRPNGAFHTCYDFYTGQIRDFVEPQLDSAGAFMLGAWLHYRAGLGERFGRKEESVGNGTMSRSERARAFLASETLLHRLRYFENYFISNIGYGGLTLPDYSIWEESSDQRTGAPLPTAYYAFTQGMVYGGLVSAALMEKALNLHQREKLVRARANDLREAIRTNLWCPGGNDGESGYYYRSIWSDSNKPDARIDASSSSILFTGLEHVRSDSSAKSTGRFESHLRTVIANLTRLQEGIARYDGDLFFYASRFDPGGREVGAPSPPWGVTTMFTAWCEALLANSAKNKKNSAGSSEGSSSESSEQFEKVIKREKKAEIRRGSPERGEKAQQQHESAQELSNHVTKRLAWMVSHAAPHGMPVGEAIDGVSGDFVMSSCPDIYEYAAVYVWTVLVSQNLAPVPDPNLF